MPSYPGAFLSHIFIIILYVSYSVTEENLTILPSFYRLDSWLIVIFSNHSAENMVIIIIRGNSIVKPDTICYHRKIFIKDIRHYFCLWQGQCVIPLSCSMVPISFLTDGSWRLTRWSPLWVVSGERCLWDSEIMDSKPHPSLWCDSLTIGIYPAARAVMSPA